jgi:hypothetical protein
MSDERAVPVPYEPPKVTFHGDLASLTKGVTGVATDALCATITQQTPSGVVCKPAP